MRKLFLALAIAVPGILLVPVVASAANSPAQIVNCAETPPWCFSPSPIRITAGSTATWSNATGVTHTATSDTGAMLPVVHAPGGTSAAVAFPTAGTFPYHCTIHPSMAGSVTVSAAAPAPSSPPARGLASGGGGPQLAIGAVLLLLGLVVLAVRGVRRNRLHGAGEGIHKLRNQ
jgi:plastocyanin